LMNNLKTVWRRSDSSSPVRATLVWRRSTLSRT
jgi:hypothetical protein